MDAVFPSLLEQARARFPGLPDPELIARVAAELIEDLAETPPVSLEVLASCRDIGTIRYEPLPYAGSLSPQPDGLVMRIHSGDSVGRQRFSGFHEVSHTFQPGFLQQTLFRCDPQLAESVATSSVTTEALADIAAAELLLPAKFFRADLTHLSLGWDDVAELAQRYQASLHATALRAVHLSSQAALLLVLEPGVRKADRGRHDVPTRLRVVSSTANARFGFIPRNKSAGPAGPLDRALAGEDVDEISSLNADLGVGSASPLRLSARLLPYLDRSGNLHERVMALYWNPTTRTGR